MAAGSSAEHRSSTKRKLEHRVADAAEDSCDLGARWDRAWHDDPEWVEDLCECLPYKELFRYKFRRSGHINCLECRTYKSWIKSISKVCYNSRLVALLDSRVTMGAVAKGRSSSKALSRILRSTLPYLIGSGLYPGTLHCRSAWNRADGPSRDGPVPPPSRPVPVWLKALLDGDTAPFDIMLTSAGWIRPVGRWYRLLLLMAGDIEQNPGPKQFSSYEPRGDLNMMGGFAQDRRPVRMQKCLEAFGLWCSTEAHVTLDEILSTAELANLGLKGYGLALFKQGAPRYWLYAITAVQQLRPEFRSCLSGAWAVDKKWQLEEPGQCRAVLSAPVLRAVLCLSLLWGWWSFAAITALGFGGMLHPNEFLQLTRRDLIFPSDSMLETRSLYVFVKNPKTSRFARKQHVRVDDDSLSFLAWCVFGLQALDTKLFPASTAAYRRQWNSIMDRLQIPRRQAEGGATPGTLRGSGATHEYLQCGNISQIQWKGRWNRLKTLEHYIQEVAAQLFLFNLSPVARQKISSLSSCLPLVLEELFPQDYKRFCEAG